MAFQTVTIAPMVSASLYRRAMPSAARIGEWRAADGWVFRRFDWPAATSGRGAILFQGGRGDTFEKYLELFAHWHGRGWSVTSLDWRGQGGSGRLSADPRVGHAPDFAALTADLAAFWQDWRATHAGPRVLVGHSMGGHFALQALMEGTVDPAAAVLVAPMLGLRSPLGAWAGERVARWMAGRGDPARAAWKSNERPASITTRQALLTHDRARYEDELWWQQANPDTTLGPPSWAWLAQAFASTRAQRADPRLATLAVPVQMLVARADKLVDPRAALAVAEQLPDCDLVAFGNESAHEILREADPVRDRAIAAIDRFLDDRAPPR